jgi:hypothetical protein
MPEDADPDVRLLRCARPWFGAGEVFGNLAFGNANRTTTNPMSGATELAGCDQSSDKLLADLKPPRHFHDPHGVSSLVSWARRSRQHILTQ